MANRVTTDNLDLLNTPDCAPSVSWTTGNVAEAFPGVFTALGASFIYHPMELTFRRMFVRLGVFAPDQVYLPERVEDRFWAMFAGRGAANIDKFREVAQLTPGTSASAVEQQLFGYVRPNTENANSYRRYPVIMSKAPKAVVTLPRRHDALFAELRGWRLAKLPVVEKLDEAGCLALLRDARDRFSRIMLYHLIVAFVSSGLADRLAEVAASAGLEDLDGRLLSGVGSDENEVARDLWALAHDELTLRQFTDRHGYHGPEEGQLSSVSWREDPSPVLDRLPDYRAIGADSPRSPVRRSRQQAEVRRQATAELMAALPHRKRPQAKLIVGATARFLALREQGKAGYLMTFDVARAAARTLGTHLVERGVIGTPDDVFHLEYDELDRITEDRHELVTQRREVYLERRDYRLPQAWEGMPTPRKVGGDGSRVQDGALSGVAASGGVAEGRARVIRDPGNAELDDGDILVCETTDPSWVSLFLVAGGLVTDFGGMLSHGPIVAREIGIPCVCGTEDGSTRIVDGQRIRVDGNAGTVEVLGSAG